jgi:Protein of unknown function (DUF4435)
VRSSVDGFSIANEIRMSRTVRKKASALLVEGAKDVRVFRNLIDESVCDIVSTEGKRNALDALNDLRKSKQSGVLVVVDADFSRLDGQQILDPDVVASDDHDMEAMLLKSPAPTKLMIEYDLKPEDFGADLGQLLASASIPMGYLRLASIKNKIHLGFNDLDYRKFVVGPPPAIDPAKLVAEVLAHNPKCKHSPTDLLGMMVALPKAEHDHWQVGCGHDMTATLAALLTGKVGREVHSYTIERQLRLSYHLTDFTPTPLCAAIRAWEQKNAPYVVLRGK